MDARLRFPANPALCEKLSLISWERGANAISSSGLAHSTRNLINNSVFIQIEISELGNFRKYPQNLLYPSPGTEVAQSGLVKRIL